MYLKRIEMRGFKSFAAAKEVVFEPGVTGIVGPNGCGKSNICDALRWALGEQNSRSLRGLSAQDVIFKGTQTRPKRDACEVSIVFDNTDGYFNLPYTELAVTRRITRAGDSEYRINGVTSRLRDITDLFRDTGVGRDGYSVIGQGQISRMLESKAADRRVVFEEAAGISGYRASLEQAEHNLTKTQDNLSRITDVLSEVEEQIKPALVQMRRAKRYVELSDELKRLDITVLLAECAAAEDGRSKSEIAYRSAEQERLDCIKERESLRQLRTDLERNLADKQVQASRAREKASVEERRYEQQCGKRAVASQKMTAASEEIAKLETDIETKNNAIGEMRDSLNQAKQGKHAASEEYHALELSVQRLKHRASVTIDRTAGEDKSSTVEELTAQLEEAERSLHSLEIASASLAQKKLDAQSHCNTIRDKLDVDNAQLAEALNNLADTEQQIRSAEKAVNLLNADIAGQEETIRSLSDALNNAERGCASAAARLDIMNRAQENYEGYYNAVRSLMHDARQNDDLLAHITGVIGESIRVQHGFEIAIEIALGAGLNDIVVPGDNDAKILVDYLKKNNYGRVTFLPSDSLKVRGLDAREQRVLRNVGVMCTADQAVSCEPGVRTAADYLLARTVIVENLDIALRLKAERLNSFRIVTLSGEVVSKGGAITGGCSVRTRSGVLIRRTSQDEAKAELGKLQQKANRLRMQLTEEKKELDALRKGYGKASGELRELSVQLRVHQADVSRAKEETLANRTAMNDARVKLNGLYAEEDDLAKQLHCARDAHERLCRRVADAKVGEESRRQAAESAVREESRLQTSIANEIARLNEVRGTLKVFEEREVHLKNAISEAETAADSAAKRLETCMRARNDAKQEMQAACEMIALAKADSARLAAESRALTDQEAQIRAQLDDLSSREGRAEAAERECTERVYRARTRTERMNETLNAASERLWTEYELTAANAEPLKRTDITMQDAKARVSAVRREIRDLGPVNPQAPDDCRRLQQRAEDLRSQIADLRNAEEDLQTAIDAIMNNMRSIFSARISEINESFGRTFRELFQGGNAQLELSGDTDVMKAGIEIMAEPPGKKLQSLALLSGGEKTLTAIALCIAMLAVNPSPVCVLDEIDAALDDQNAVRLSDYLHSMSHTLQFIVITHRKTTMAACDALYGVSMPEPGISEVASVRLH